MFGQDQLFGSIEPKRFTEPNLDKGEAAKRLRAAQLQSMYRMSDPETSSAAALAKLPGLGHDKQRIMNLMAQHPEGLTSSQVSHVLNMDKGTSSKRLGDLEGKDKLLRRDGVRLSDRNRKSTVYKLT